MLRRLQTSLAVGPGSRGPERRAPTGRPSVIAFLNFNSDRSPDIDDHNRCLPLLFLTSATAGDRASASLTRTLSATPSLASLNRPNYVLEFDMAMRYPGPWRSRQSRLATRDRLALTLADLRSRRKIPIAYTEWPE